MSAWMNDAVANHNGNGFAHLNDPNAAGGMIDPSAFMANQGQLNPAAFTHQQQLAGMQNDPTRHGSPSAYQSSMYQTNSVIPSKRPRPREDSLTASPRQAQGMLPPSRSETPQQQQQQQNFAAMQGGVAIPQQTPGQFPHLQSNGSANASPSPIMGNQMRPGSVPQRVATVSPHPFSPGAQQFGAQTSPVPSEHGTPQPNQYMQNLPQNYNPAFAPSPSNARPSPGPNAMSGTQMMPQHMGQMPQGMGQMPGNMYAQMQQQQQHSGQQHLQQPPQQQQLPPQQHSQSQQRPQGLTDQQKMAAYQMRLQQQLQGNMQMQAQLQAQSMGRGMMSKQQMAGMPNGQLPQGGMRPQQRPMGGMNPEQFMKNLSALMSSRGLPLDPNPMIGDRPVNLMMLFQAVSSKGGYKPVTNANGWAHIAQAMGLPAHIPSIPPTLKQIYERNLLKFEEAWLAQQKQRLMQQNPPPQGQAQRQVPQAPPINQAQTPQNQHGVHQQSQPQQHPQQHQQPQSQQQPPQPKQTPVKGGQAILNGYATPQGPHSHPHQSPSNVPNLKSSLSRSSVEPPTGNDASLQSPVHQQPGNSALGQLDGRQTSLAPLDGRIQTTAPKTDDYTPINKELTTYGGIDLHATNALGAEIERWKPVVPPVNDLGNIDVHALTRSLQSGIHGEVRLALDTLAAVSNSPNQMHFIQLRYCDDLVEALIECAEEQVDKLTDDTVEVSDEVQLSSYEDIVRACRMERWAVKSRPGFGTHDYELDRAADRLICITTILRNVSFPGEQNENHMVLADETVIKFICVVIRSLGTRTMLLRTNSNTLDFMKDIVILLSNIAGAIEVPGREQALCLLHFLLAFAPSPAPTIIGGELLFAYYEPSVHPYLPHAVDALAKLLARDEPNRGYYKSIFGLDGMNDTSNDLLTRTFALCISPTPEQSKEHVRPQSLPSLIEIRKPLLMQGFLAAEILASMAPGHESGLAKSWLASGNSLAQNLSRLIQELSRIYEQPQAFGRGATRSQPRKDSELVYIVVVAVTLLRTLAEKARDPSDPQNSLPKSLLPSTRVLMEALSMQSPEWTKEGMLQQLSSVISLAG